MISSHVKIHITISSHVKISFLITINLDLLVYEQNIFESPSVIFYNIW